MALAFTSNLATVARPDQRPRALGPSGWLREVCSDDVGFADDSFEYGWGLPTFTFNLRGLDSAPSPSPTSLRLRTWTAGHQCGHQSVQSSVTSSGSFSLWNWTCLCPKVHVGDSSDRGYALMSTQASHAEVREALRRRERWRFRHSAEPPPLPVHDDIEAEQLGYVGQTPLAGLGTQTQFGKELTRALDVALQDPLFKQRRARLLGAPKEVEKTVIAGPGIPPLAGSWDDPLRWTLVTAKAWDNVKEHINFKEARVCLMGLRRLCRTVRNLGTTALTITDNLVSALAFEKGRSGSRPLNNLCRQAAAYQLGGRIQWRLRHIESKRNVADEPSRRFGPDLPRPYQLGRLHDDDGAGAELPRPPEAPVLPDPRLPGGHGTQGLHCKAISFELGHSPDVRRERRHAHAEADSSSFEAPDQTWQNTELLFFFSFSSLLFGALLRHRAAD